MAMMRYCLECGYSRQGLSQDALCPECGEADVFEKQRDVCASLAARPWSLLWRVATLRRLPKGWWVVFEDKPLSRYKPWQIVLSGVLVLSAFSALGMLVRIESTTTAFFYDVNDPQRSVIAEIWARTDRHNLAAVDSSYTIQLLPMSAPIAVSNPRTGYKRSTRIAFGRDPSGSGPDPRLIGFLLAYTIAVWLLSRFVWLPLIARDRRGPAFRHAAQQTAVIYVAHVIWLIAASLVGFLATLTMSLVSTVPLHWINIPCAVLLIVMMIIGPGVIWWRVMSADSLRYEFPRRMWAGVLLFGLTLVTAVGVRITWPWFWLGW